MVVQILDPLQKLHLFYCAVLVLKMLAMSFLTARQRFKNKVFISPEDTKSLRGSRVQVNEDVERVRRAHLNDLENIPIFFVASYCYIMTNPPYFLALNLFRVFAAARIAHTFVYAIHVVPQPARALAFAVGFVITAYMGVTSILHFM